MWQVMIPIKNNFEKEEILEKCYIFPLTGIWEKENELVVFFNEEKDVEEFKKSLKEQDFYLCKIKEKINWLSHWKKYHRPVRIKPFYIVPSFRKVKVVNGYKKILINPSFAFGTGSHATTRLCIEFLIKSVEKGMSILDLGTGTGILAICAEKLGGKDIYAIDNDPIAIKEAMKNIKRNRCKNIKVMTEISEIKNFFDVCVCNIICDEIIKLKPFITNVVKKKGKLILSGLLENQREIILKEFSDSFKIQGFKKKKDKNFIWIALLFEKR